ncbi:MAG: protein kinase [Pirellulaceae bacterium]|nr:protein kinase [Pirellulaceae bacterium]
MSHEKTQQQTPHQLEEARAISRSSTAPPCEVPGYSLLRHLGSGAFGEVWLAMHEITRRRVAIKFYNRRSLSDVRGLAKEVEKLVALSADRYVVQLLDVGWEADPPYYVMDFIEHGSLEDLLKAEGKLPLADALEIFEETARGLMHLHGKGIFHCDLKPGNILLDQDRHPRLADFGQSRLSNEALPSLGTLFYMAPEQADLSALPDAKWDVYALGAVFYSMLTGRPPHYDQTITTELESSGDIHQRLEKYRKSILRSPPPDKHRTIPGVDRQLADIIDRCVAANPKRRFDSVQSILLAVRQRQDTIQRRPLLILGLVGPLLLLSVLMVFGWQAYRRAVLDSDIAITQKAVEANRFAARLAARTAAEQLDGYFRELTELGRNKEFSRAIVELLRDEKFSNLGKQIGDPNRNNDPSIKYLRDMFLADPARRALHEWLTKHHEERRPQHVVSWLIYDRMGNQVVGVFLDPDSGELEKKPSPTVGKNYSFRTYFTGLNDDLVDDDPEAQRRFVVSPDPSQRKIIQGKSLSSVFLSEQSDTWKIAFAQPIYDGDEIIGVMAVSVQMGEFVNFDAGKNQYAMLYDSRPGSKKGVILEHPVFGILQQRGEVQPKDSIAMRVQLEKISQPIFEDPLSQLAAGEEFGGERLVATAPITFNNEESVPVDSGLNVAVLEDYREIIRPSHELGNRLVRMAITAGSVLLLVAVGMWGLVARMFKLSRKRLARAVSRANDSDSLSARSYHDGTTLPRTVPQVTQTPKENDTPENTGETNL